MNTKLKMVLMVAALIGLVLGAGFAFAGCATPPRQSHGEVTVSAPTPLVTGPARGHWEEQDGHAVIAYTVLGNECTYLAAQAQAPTFESRGSFILGPGVTLCVIPLRNHEQRILFHVERP
jgi:hypothetical protein